MKIGELALRADISRSSIRHYEHIGLLAAAGRDAAGYRCYGEADLQRVRIIVAARRLGICLKDAKELVAVREDGTPPSARVMVVLNAKLSEVGRRASILEYSRIELSRLREQVEAGRVPDES